MLSARDDLPGLNIALRKRKAERVTSRTRWAIDYAGFAALFQRFAAASSVQIRQPHSHSVRLGGASDDARRRRRTMLEIRLRGGWAADASIRRFRKHTRLLRESEQLPAAVRGYGELVAAMTIECLAQSRRPPAPPPAAGGTQLLKRRR